MPWRWRTALHVIHLERSLGAFFEPGFQQAFVTHQWVIEIANWMYFNTHFLVTISFLAWLYLFRNENFNFVRNMFMVAMGLALVGYALFPTAPPRMFPGAGFTDTIAMFTNMNQDSAVASVLVNPYAAVPSMHIAFSLMVAVCAMSLVRSVWARAVWSAYPLLVFFVIVVTANHFWFDAAAGAAVACLAAVSAHQLARAAPGRLVLARGPRAGRDLTRPAPAPESPAGRGRSADLPRAPRLRRPVRCGPLASTPMATPGRELRDVRTAEELRAYARGRLIESRLTPNAISLSGLLLNLAAAVLITQRLFFLAGVAFIVGSVMDTLDGRYSRMSGKGTPVRRLPRLHARPDRGGAGADRRCLVLRRPAATRSPRRPAWSRCWAR